MQRKQLHHGGFGSVLKTEGKEDERYYQGVAGGKGTASSLVVVTMQLEGGKTIKFKALVVKKVTE